MPRQASLRTLRGPDGQILDHGLVLWFPGPASYTGEDCVELHLHAGPAVIDAVAEALHVAGGRPAGPGEFTQRAFLKGRIDLIEAEGLADLIEAETEAQRRQALAQSRGTLSALYAGWSAALRRIVAQQEAFIDFPSESEGVTADHLDAEMATLEDLFLTHLGEGRRGQALRRGLTVAITGSPNVGKSSLVNVLAGRDVSIVSDRPGTTRDVVETRFVLGGIPLTLIDTAGIRDSEDELEREGVRRAHRSVGAADIVLRVTCGNDAGPTLGDNRITIDVSNKIDLYPALPRSIGVSALTGEGIDALRNALGKTAERLTSGSTLPPFTRARHRDCVERSLAHLQAARAAGMAELRGEELRLALHELGRLTGAVGVEDILSDIFSTFCIGK